MLTPMTCGHIPPQMTPRRTISRSVRNDAELYHEVHGHPVLLEIDDEEPHHFDHGTSMNSTFGDHHAGKSERGGEELADQPDEACAPSVPNSASPDAEHQRTSWDGLEVNPAAAHVAVDTGMGERRHTLDQPPVS
jgi:hypothetical protein